MRGGSEERTRIAQKVTGKVTGKNYVQIQTFPEEIDWTKTINKQFNEEGTLECKNCHEQLICNLDISGLKGDGGDGSEMACLLAKHK